MRNYQTILTIPQWPKIMVWWLGSSKLKLHALRNPTMLTVSSDVPWGWRIELQNFEPLAAWSEVFRLITDDVDRGKTMTGSWASIWHQVSAVVWPELIDLAELGGEFLKLDCRHSRSIPATRVMGKCWSAFKLPNGTFLLQTYGRNYWNRSGRVGRSGWLIGQLLFFINPEYFGWIFGLFCAPIVMIFLTIYLAHQEFRSFVLIYDTDISKYIHSCW